MQPSNVKMLIFSQEQSFPPPPKSLISTWLLVLYHTAGNDTIKFTNLWKSKIYNDPIYDVLVSQLIRLNRYSHQ